MVIDFTRVTMLVWSLSNFFLKSKTCFIMVHGLGLMWGGGCSGQPLPWLASDVHPDGHECAKGAAALHHGFPDTAHQTPTPYSDPETGKDAEERPRRHARGATHHKTHLHEVEAAWLELCVGTQGHQHLACGLGHFCSLSDLKIGPYTSNYPIGSRVCHP